MTWTVNLNGHDDLTGDEKVAFEEGLVEKTRELVETLKAQDGSKVSIATVTTNTTGSVNLLDAVSQA
jgi:hypothetical protein